MLYYTPSTQPATPRPYPTDSVIVSTFIRSTRGYKTYMFSNTTALPAVPINDVLPIRAIIVKTARVVAVQGAVDRNILVLPHTAQEV